MNKLIFLLQIAGQLILVAAGVVGVLFAYRALGDTGLNAWVAAQSVAHPAQAGLALVASSLAILTYSFTLLRSTAPATRSR